MRTALWLAAREIAGRAGGFVLGAAVLAAVVALAMATDALGRGREERVSAQMDNIAAPLEILPAAVSATQLARGELGSGSLPPSTVSTIHGVLKGSLRELESRLIVEGTLAGRTTILVGTAGGGPSAPKLQDDQVAVGATLAERLALRRGDSIAVMGASARVGMVLPSSGNIEDESALLPLARLQRLVNEDGRINHVRIFLRAGTDVARSQELLERSGLGANVVRRDRGDVVDRDAPRSLSIWRAAAFAAAAAACAAWLAFVTRLNLLERRREMATLAAIGARGEHLVTAVVLRSAAIAATGAMVGIIAGIAVGQILSVPTFEMTPLAFFAAAVSLSALVATPVAALAARADPVDALDDE